jgi:hypothetical protein
MTDDEIMRQLSQARDDDVLAAEEMVKVGQEQHPEWDWPFPPTARRFTRQELKRDLPGSSDHCPSVLAEHPAAWVALPSLSYREVWCEEAAGRAGALSGHRPYAIDPCEVDMLRLAAEVPQFHLKRGPMYWHQRIELKG